MLTETLEVLGYLPGAKKDAQSITKDWEPLQSLIEGVHVREVKTVIKDRGCLTELYRHDWEGMTEVRHIFQEVLLPGQITAWHLHIYTTDRIFAATGTIKIVLYDARENSSTRGRLNLFRFGTPRPGLVVVPPGVWHGVMNVASKPSLLLNITDRVYEYEHPDHWRLPADTDQIPYSFSPR